MSYEPQLNNEVNAILDRLATDGEAWRAGWVAHQVCETHKSGLAEGEDREFWHHCTYQKVRDTVRRVINQRAGDRPDDEENQLRLPGYDHLQSYYIVKRDDEEVGVPVHDLSDDELEAKSALYRTMAKACYAHADELDRFKRLRRVESDLFNSTQDNAA